MYSSPEPQPLAIDVSEQRRLDLIAAEAGPAFRDPAFAENKTLPIHRWVPWVAGFSSGFVQDCLSAFLPDEGETPRLVLDPFAGVGTTLVTAATAGHDAVGFEINPWAALASRAKSCSLNVDASELFELIAHYTEASKSAFREAEGSVPEGFISRIPFFSPMVESQVFGFMAYLRTIKNQTLADLFRTAFGSVMVSFSNYTYEPSLSTRPGAGKPLIYDADVHGTVRRKLLSMLADIQAVQLEAHLQRAPQTQVHWMNFMQAAEVMDRASADVAVTSPPYLNNYHYIRSTRPHLYWLGLLSERKDFHELEDANIGKYWQTVRGKEQIALDFGDSRLEETITQIRETRTDKGIYGGAGWANYVASYFNDSDKFLASLGYVMKPGAVAVIVVGNSIIQGHEIRVDDVLMRLAPANGFTPMRIEMLRTKRVGASITKSTVRRGDESAASLYESAVILRRDR